MRVSSPLKTKNCHDANFVVTGGIEGCQPHKMLKLA